MIEGSERRGVLAAGNYLVDLVKTIDAWPEQDGLANILSLHRSNGGGPYNVLMDLARMQVDCPLAALGRVGEDDLGAFVREDLIRNGIDCEQLIGTREAPTSYTDVMTIKDTGRRTFFHMRGANALLDGDDFDFTHPRHRIFYLGYLMLLDRLDQMVCPGETGFGKVLEKARVAGYVTVADTVSSRDSRFSEVVSAALPYLDALVLNEWEASMATGRDLIVSGKIDLAEVERAASDLLEKGDLTLIAIHFPTGAYARQKDGQSLYQPAVKVPASRIKGTVGAGDAFCAGIVHSLHNGDPLDRMLESAVCIAAASLLSPTASGGILPLSACLELGRKFGFRVSPS